MNKQRLEILCDFLEKLAPEQFDYSNWLKGWNGDSDPFANECKTIACAGGWACKLFPDVLKLITRIGDDPTVYSIADDKSGAAALATCFDLTMEEASYLFVPIRGLSINGNNYRYSPDYDAGPKEVALHIRSFIAQKELPTCETQ